MPGTPIPPPANAHKTGPIHAVPCAHCGLPNDLRKIKDEGVLERGGNMECDHCHMFSEIVAIQPVTIIAVRQSKKMRGRAQTAAAAPPARTVSPGALAQMFRKRR